MFKCLSGIDSSLAKSIPFYCATVEIPLSRRRFVLLKILLGIFRDWNILFNYQGSVSLPFSAATRSFYHAVSFLSTTFFNFFNVFFA